MFQSASTARPDAGWRGMRSGPASSNRSSEGLPGLAPAAGRRQAPPKRRPFLAAFVRVLLLPFPGSTTLDRPRSTEKAFASTTLARARAAHRQPLRALDTDVQWLPEQEGKLHSSHTVPDIVLDLSEYSDSRCSARTC